MLRTPPALALGAALLFTLAPAGAQSSRVLPYPIFDDPGFPEAIEAGSRSAAGVPGPAYWTDFAEYDLEVELDPARALVTGRGKLAYRNRSPRPLRELRIHLRQNLHREGAMRNREVSVTGGMAVTGVSFRLEDGDPRPIRPRVAGTVMTIPLPGDSRIPPGGTGIVDIEWSFTVPAAGTAPRMGHDRNRVFYLGYWYPQFAVHEDVAGWVSQPYLGAGEFYMGYADYNLSFTAPAGFLVRATGELLNPEEVLTEVQMERLRAAASTRDVQQILTAEELAAGGATRTSPSGLLTWRFQARNVRDIAVSASDQYVWDATHAAIPGRDGPSEGGIAMVHAVYRPRARFWPNAAESCRHTLEFMSREISPYPWPHMTCCEGIIGGGMEFPMMTLCGNYPNARGLHGVIAHETIHMWWPMMVGTDEKRWSWMDEGLTSFMGSRAAADFYGRGDPPRQAAIQYRAAAQRGGEIEIMRHSDLFDRTDGGAAYGFATYSKTAAVFHQLRGMLGEKLFDETLSTFARNWSWKHPYPRDLFSAFSQAAGRDLDWYFRMWLYETWTLDPAIGGVDLDGDATVVMVEDRGLAYGPVVVEAEFEDREPERTVIPAETWSAGARSAQVRFEGRAVRIVIDPEGATLDIDPSNNTWTRPR